MMGDFMMGDISSLKVSGVGAMTQVVLQCRGEACYLGLG